MSLPPAMASGPTRRAPRSHAAGSASSVSRPSSIAAGAGKLADAQFERSSLMKLLQTILIAAASLGLATGLAGAAGLPDLGGRKVLAVTENAYTPLNFADPKTGEGIGWEYDAFNEIGKRLNLKVEWKQASWDTMIEAVRNGQFDVGMDGITITDERKKQVDFSDPYMVSQQFMLVRADEKRFTDAKSFGANK